ncbi:MAG TPA: rod shape-determining protein RodA [Verrucomicrobiales bacterium]|nr:rod shape-determining protein RodA [Verrucomicrobiales bacterium]
MKTKFLTTAFLSLAVAGVVVAAATLPKTPSPDGASCYIISPKDGETVSGTFTVLFGLKGMGVAPAGVKLPNTGHHHLLIDVGESDKPDFNLPLPMSDTVKHFGGGQTEAEITLPPGKHTLQLVLGDHLHIPHEPPVVSKKITVTVK